MPLILKKRTIYAKQLTPSAPHRRGRRGDPIPVTLAWARGKNTIGIFLSNQAARELATTIHVVAQEDYERNIRIIAHRDKPTRNGQFPIQVHSQNVPTRGTRA